MKRIGTYLLYGGALVFAIAFIYISISPEKKIESGNRDASAQGANSKTVAVQGIKPAEKIQLYLFHSTNRCYSCVTAGKYAKEVLEQNFSSELKSGKIEFREINIDLPENKEVAKKFKALGTSLFVNYIIDGTDNIKEDVQIWRLVSNQKSFSDYLVKTLKNAIGNEVSVQMGDVVEKKDIVFYIRENCLGCANIQKYINENEVRNKVGFEEKNIDKNEADAEQMAEDAMYCNMDVDSFGAPFLRVQEKCYVEEKDIIDFFDNKLSSLR